MLAAFAGSTRATCVFFTQLRRRPTPCRIIDVPASTGYGEPIQKLFKLKDGEKDRRRAEPRPARRRRHHAEEGRRRRRRCTRVAVTSDGYALRFSLEPFVEPSTRAGRRYARPAEGAEVVGVARLTGGEIAHRRHAPRRAASSARPTR